MNRSEEDMKSVGFFGIFKESFKFIFSLKKIFSQITLTLILPLAIIFLAHMEISRRYFHRIERNSWLSDPYDTYRRRGTTASDWLYYWLFEIAYFTLLAVFSLLSTAAVVFTIASVYTGHNVGYRNVMKVVPKVWKKLCNTFLCIYLALIIYDAVLAITLVIAGSIFKYSIIGIILLCVILILYISGFLYLSVVCQLASVISVLETVYGLKAMRKGTDLVKGKKRVAIGIAFVLHVFLLGLGIVYELFVEYGDKIFKLNMVSRVMIGIACGFLLMSLFLLFMVSQTVIYLVCKSHHREAIDKLSLSNYFGAYLNETVLLPKEGEEMQVGRPQPQPPLQQV